jgi:protocatechuate 3,4-dioxygenase beta subunit
VLDDLGKPIPNALLEIWQANAAGRYLHKVDQHAAPLDPNFYGAGRTITDEDGEYRFTTIRPGAYPWGNHYNAWRPAHIHFSVCGINFLQRLVTQMYFPGDPLMELDPIYNGIPDDGAKKRLVSTYDHEVTTPDWALGFRFDIVVCGPNQTPFE